MMSTKITTPRSRGVNKTASVRSSKSGRLYSFNRAAPLRINPQQEYLFLFLSLSLVFSFFLFQSIIIILPRWECVPTSAWGWWRSTFTPARWACSWACLSGSVPRMPSLASGRPEVPHTTIYFFDLFLILFSD